MLEFTYTFKGGELPLVLVTILRKIKVENLSLKELKAQNADIEEIKQGEVIEDVKENIQEKPVERDKPIKAVEEEAESSEDAATEEPETESWMQAEEPETSDDDKSGFVPNHEAAKRRKQAKALRGELSDVKDENQELKERIAALEAGSAPKESKSNDLEPRPTREQFDYDDDAYDAAIDAWNDKRFEVKLNAYSQTSQQQSQKEAQQQAISEALTKNVNSHYERAQKLVDDGKVNAESYQNADKMFRLEMDSIFKGEGHQVTDNLISTLSSLGDGSEKVIYQLGVNQAKMSELKSRLMNDPSGLSAMAYLGQLQSSIQTPTKKRSQAPRPGAKVDGETGSSGKAGAIHKEYSKSTDIQHRISLKRQARKQGVDVSNW